MGNYKKLKRKFENYQFECEDRFDKIEKHLGLNTEVTVSKMESVEELPEITKVQVNCSNLTKEQIQELADIVLERNFKIWDYQTPLKDKLNKLHIWFRMSEDGDFAVFSFRNERAKTISYEQFKDFYKKIEKPLSIREVQVKVSSQEEANECAEIAKECGEKIWSNSEALGIYGYYNFFRFYEDNFHVTSYGDTQTEISIQEYRERFGKGKTEIDWSKAGQLVESKWNVVITSIIDSRLDECEFSGLVLVNKFPNNEDNYKVGFYSETWAKESFKLCTEPITLSND